MTRERMLRILHDVLSDDVMDYRWSDDLLKVYLAEAQDVFCERTGYFIDKTSFTVTLVEGQTEYAIPDRVIQILDVYDGTKRLGKFQDEDRPSTNNEWSPNIDPVVYGRPTSWQADNRTGYLTLDNEPTADEAGDTLTLRVWRYSTNPLDDDDVDGAGTDAEPEIPNRFHLALVEYAAYKALMHHDEEQQDPVKAADHLRAFERYIVEAKTFMRRYHGVEARLTVNTAYVGV